MDSVTGDRGTSGAVRTSAESTNLINISPLISIWHFAAPYEDEPKENLYYSRIRVIRTNMRKVKKNTGDTEKHCSNVIALLLLIQLFSRDKIRES